MDEDDYELNLEEFKKKLAVEVQRAKERNAKLFKRQLIKQLGFLCIILIMIVATLVQVIYPKSFSVTNWIIALSNIGIAIVLFVQYLGCTWSKKWAALLFFCSMFNMVLGVTKLI